MNILNSIDAIMGEHYYDTDKELYMWENSDLSVTLDSDTLTDLDVYHDGRLIASSRYEDNEDVLVGIVYAIHTALISRCLNDISHD